MSVNALNNEIQAYSAGVSKEGAIKLSSNESPFPPSPAVHTAMVKAIHNAHLYPDMAQTELKAAIAAKDKVDIFNIVLGNGSGEILSFIAQRILNPNSEVIISENTFSLYSITSQLAGASIKKIALVEGYCNIEEIHNAITLNTAVIFLPNPNNPTGTAHTRESILSFLNALPLQVYIVLDEAYMDFADTEYHIEMEDIFKAHERSIVLRTFSKLFALGGMRLGYAISSEETCQRIKQAKLPFTINRAVSAGARAALAEPAYQDKTRNYIRKERDTLNEIYTHMGISFFPTQANFFCIGLGTHAKTYKTQAQADRAFEFFAEHNIMIRALTSFGMPTHIRVTIGTHAHNKLFCAALEKFIVSNA